MDSSIRSLFATIEDVIQFLVKWLPSEFIKPLSDAMMPDLSARLKEVWLDTAVPASLDELLEYQKSLAQVHEFAEKLDMLSWPGGAAFEDWISDAPKNWIMKRREITLDWTRNQLALGKLIISSCMLGRIRPSRHDCLQCLLYIYRFPVGTGVLQTAEHVERRMVRKDESKQIAESGNMANQDWDAAWDSEEEENNSLPRGTNRASLEEERRASEVYTQPANDDDDTEDAWGWGDEVEVDEPMSEDVEPSAEHSPVDGRSSPETREIILSEKYKISSIPQPIFNTISGIFNDGARLTSPECVCSFPVSQTQSDKICRFDNSPVTPAAPILFNLPTMVLALYRSVSPYYYTYHPSGNMQVIPTRSMAND